MIIDINDVKEFSKSYPDDDVFITRRSNSAENFVINFLGYNPIKKDYTSKIMGNNSDSLYLESFPINGSITIDGVEYTDYVSYKNIITIPNEIFKYKKLYTVSYNAGNEIIPAQIYEAMIQIASLGVKELGSVGTSKRSDPTGSIEYISFTNFDRYTNNIKNLKLLKEYV